MRIMLLFVLILSLANSVFAAETMAKESIFPEKMTAKALMIRCSSSSMSSAGRQRQKYCSGFVSGVEESARLLGKTALSPKICLPEGKSASQYTKIYMHYASKKTTELTKPAALIVIEALQHAFPCPVTE